jgi:hypothetical protein
MNIDGYPIVFVQMLGQFQWHEVFRVLATLHAGLEESLGAQSYGKNHIGRDCPTLGRHNHIRLQMHRGWVQAKKVSATRPMIVDRLVWIFNLINTEYKMC